MNDDQWVNLVWIVGALLLVSSAISMRRLSFGALLRGVVSWVLIFGLVYVLVLNRDVVRGFFWNMEERLTYGEQSLEGGEVRIRLSPDGHFWANGTINGVPRRLLVDSGATMTALSAETAAAVGVATTEGGMPVVLTTANGSVAAKRGNIDRLAIGELEARNLPVVVSPAFGNINVLGMNFLSRLRSWRVEGRTLILDPKPEQEQSGTARKKAD